MSRQTDELKACHSISHLNSDFSIDVLKTLGAEIREDIPEILICGDVVGLPNLQGYIEQSGLKIFSAYLYRHLQTHDSALIMDWFISVDEEKKYVSLTNPYGLDVCFCNNTYENCEFICETIVNKILDLSNTKIF